jgi:hypothetical protein
VKRWLVLTLGLGVAAIAGLSLLGVEIGSHVEDSESHVHAQPHHDDIDQQSRDKMRAILRQAEAEGADAR